MATADPNFVMAHVMANGLTLLAGNKSIAHDPVMQAAVAKMAQLAAKNNITDRERNHVSAVKLWAEGDTPGACKIWEDILLDHPTDLLALKMAADTYFFNGMKPEMRDSVSRVLPSWKPSIPLYGYLTGMHAFTLEETYLYDEAVKTANKALNINPKDGFATHAISHVYEMRGEHNKGIDLMSSNERDWVTCRAIAGHCYWHWAVYHVEKGEYEKALDIFDAELGKRCNDGNMLDLTDACSMLYRLEMEGVNVGERWNEILETCQSHVGDHVQCFTDAHILMALLGAKEKEIAKQMMDSIKSFAVKGRGHNHEVAAEVGVPLCEAFEAYDNGDFGKAVDLLYPIRYKVIKIGGSHAQRDVFNLFLIQAALKSQEKKHHKIARILLNERKALKENSPMTDRLIQKALALHAD
ncbi:tetratricopeptide repeat protein 38 isoform X3 [Lingula anatina]|nr:tetratricopeptide repeat protein 38 isoform X3 [Lingula anatina]|eukprot:XP_013418392.1 tetratricopeptide repeat protein 38 isoform X3 [Lingula anatina]